MKLSERGNLTEREDAKMPYMGYTDARNRASQKYQKEHFEQLNFKFPKGFKETLLKHLEMTGETQAEFVRRAIAEAMERDIVKARESTNFK